MEGVCLIQRDNERLQVELRTNPVKTAFSLPVDHVSVFIEQRELSVMLQSTAHQYSCGGHHHGIERLDRKNGNAADDSAGHYGTIALVRLIDSAVPSISSGARLLSWQTYSNSSWLEFQRIKTPLVHGAV